MANRQRAMEGLELNVWQTDREQWKAWSLRYGEQTESYGRVGAEGMANRQTTMEGLEPKLCGYVALKFTAVSFSCIFKVAGKQHASGIIVSGLRPPLYNWFFFLNEANHCSSCFSLNNRRAT